jgi:ubiquinone/menaquinone biosynthesis C-methylase UbiE
LFLVDNPFRRLWRRPKKFLSRYLAEGEVAADLGCGPGFFTLPMAKIVDPAGRVFAVDTDEKSIKALKLRLSGKGYSNVDARLASAADLAFIATHSVKFVMGDGLICCMADRDRGVREIIRILRPGGVAYLSVAKSVGKEKPTDVSKAEWRGIRDLFDVVREGESLGQMRWAIVSSKGA